LGQVLGSLLLLLEYDFCDYPIFLFEEKGLIEGQEKITTFDFLLNSHHGEKLG
jgi:hypothetical protein